MQQVHISTFVGISAFCFGAAVWRHLDPGVPPPRADVSRIPPWIFIVVNGFLALVALAALIGIWFGRTTLFGSAISFLNLFHRRYIQLCGVYHNRVFGILRIKKEKGPMKKTAVVTGLGPR